MIYSYGLSIGLKLLMHGKLRQALSFLIRPVNYWRNIEFDFALRYLEMQSHEKVLDIGSPKLLSIYLAKHHNINIYATDINDYFILPFCYLRDVENINPDKYHLKVEDGRYLSFEDDSFDKVYSISVIEHIPDQGDIECVKEIYRILRPGGRCVITVPFAQHSKLEFRKPDFYWVDNSPRTLENKIFFQRRYSEKDIANRLIQPSKLKCKKIEYVGEKIFTRSEKELCNYLPAFTGPIQPLLSKLFLSKRYDDWHKLKKPLCALIVLEK